MSKLKQILAPQQKRNTASEFTVLPLPKSNLKKGVSTDHFSQLLWSIEGVCVVLQCPPKLKIPDYPYKRKLSGTSTISQLRKRLSDALGPDIKYVIVLGNGDTQPHGNITLNNARSSYLMKAS